MARLVVLARSDLRSDPRVRRQLAALSLEHSVTAVGWTDPEMEGVAFVPLLRSAAPRRGRRLREALGRACGLHQSVYFAEPEVQALSAILADLSADLILANDLDTLPAAIRAGESRGIPVHFDAHEFAPGEFAGSWRWRLLRGRQATALCRRYVSRASSVTTVCSGLAEAWASGFGVEATVITNAAPFADLRPTATREGNLRLVHHGIGVPDRRIETMIAVAAALGEGWSLDLMLMPNNPGYLGHLGRLAQEAGNVRLVPPVPMPEIVSTLNRKYDVGLFLLEPDGPNKLHALPNKLFEFLQARLAIAIGPSPEMARIVRTHGLGVVAEDFRPSTLAAGLRSLGVAGIDRAKAAAHATAASLAAESEAGRLRSVMTGTLGRKGS